MIEAPTSPPEPMRLLPTLVLALAATAHAARPALRHVPSPDWRDQIVYFVVTDRFADGNAANNDQGAGEYDPSSKDRYNGGDLAGLTQRLDYIRGLGATALWITPPVANQWTDPIGGHSGYHGYWAEHFKKVDKHLGTLADYRRLAEALHGQGMYLVQDIVLNHTGDFFDYRGGWSASDPARFYTPNAQAKPAAAPSQPPFNLNDPRVAAHRRAGIYHWTPRVADYTDPLQEHSFQMSGLDDLNTENPRVRRALRDSYGWWIREVGVDAFRVDTAFFVPPEVFADFLYSQDRVAPGVLNVARRTGRRQFHVFGEGFAIDKPYADTGAAKIERYMTGPGGRTGQPLLPGMLNFPLYGSLGDVFARGRPSAELGWRITHMMQRHARPHLMPSFVDNHDVDRFLAGAGVAALKQSLLAMMTLPGIPTIYYGTEQGFTEPRAAMFARGFGSGGRDHYDGGAPLYRFIAEASAMRRANKVFSRGWPKVLKDNAAGAGALAWRMDHAGRRALVVFNTADSDALLDNLDTGLAAGTRLQGLFGIDGTPRDVVVGAQGRVTMPLAARGGQVWQVTAQRLSPAPARGVLTLDALPAATVSGDFGVSGSTDGVTRLQLVVDGALAQAQTVAPGADGRWQASVDTSTMVDPAARHSVVAWDASSGAVSATREFHVQREWRVVADLADPAGDDHGPAGRYTYPTDPGWGANRQMDLRRIKVSASGSALRLDLTMAKLTTLWNPANGFDHVAFTIFIELPGRDGGSRVMPLQNASLPPGMAWHLRLRAHGWSNALFTSAGASTTNEGTPASTAAQIVTDPASHTVSFLLPAAALGRLPSLSGVKLYVSTWDYDGGYRALGPEAQPYALGGGHADSDARVMDDTPVIVLP